MVIKLRSISVAGFIRYFMFLALSVFLFGCDFDILATPEKIKQETKQSIEAKDFTKAAGLAQKYIEKVPTDYEGYFYLAQSKSQTGDKNAAIVALEMAIKNGLKDDQQIEENSNLDPIKLMVAYADLMRKSFPGREEQVFIQTEREVPAGISVGATSSTSSGTSVSASSGTSAQVSIKESNGKQIIRAGDIVIKMPIDK